jgi:hypothetical protein
MRGAQDMCDFFRGAIVRCGACGKLQQFGIPSYGGDTLARQAGWQIEWRPLPFVRCPKCRVASPQRIAQEARTTTPPSSDGEGAQQNSEAIRKPTEQKDTPPV